ncbi:response regulator [Sphingomonas sp. GM_Shp_2]|uniref:response regulator n=1 Tax=Sphingomonas sp. GM_Shp_2 TaxID=2937380 RepID=UPI002269B923|nr:response regulator [Sphingomonas sp. GM_Shp_2]
MTMSAIPPVILVVADQPLLSLAAVDLAEQAGFMVVTAGDAQDAVAMLAKRSDIAIVLADLDRPGRARGAELAAVIARQWPTVRVLVLTDRVDQMPGEVATPTIIRPCADRVIVAALTALSGSGSAGSGR